MFKLLEGYFGSEANWWGRRWKGWRERNQGREGALHTLPGTWGRGLGFFVVVEAISTVVLAVVTFGGRVVTNGGCVTLTVEVTIDASVTVGAMVEASVVTSGVAEASVVTLLVSGFTLESTVLVGSVGSSWVVSNGSSMSTGNPTSWAVTPPGFPLLVKLVGMLSTLFLFRKERREETSVLAVET